MRNLSPEFARNVTWRYPQLCCAVALLGAILPAGPVARGQAGDLGDARPLLKADLRLEKPIVQAGQPVWAEFTLSNLTAEPMTLQVPDAPVAAFVGEQMGLPISHVFSGVGHTGVSIKDSRGELLDTHINMRPRSPVPPLRLAPYGTVGVRVDLTRYYDALVHRPGKYTLTWKPYNGTVEAPPQTVTLLAEQQAVILTDFGEIKMRFYYDQAPMHVQNFIELVQARFYDNLTFHRVVPGGLIQGGDPRGDGRGRHPDGRRLKAEFSSIPFELGTVGMARSPRDPDSASCQFFISLGRQPAFDGTQTAFAYVVGDASFETLRKIAAVPTGPNDRPKTPVRIVTISLENVPPRERHLDVTSTRPAGYGAPHVARNPDQIDPNVTGIKRATSPISLSQTPTPPVSTQPTADSR